MSNRLNMWSLYLRDLVGGTKSILVQKSIVQYDVIPGNIHYYQNLSKEIIRRFCYLVSQLIDVKLNTQHPSN